METEKWINDESKYHPDEISHFSEGNSCPRTILQCLNVAEPKPRWTKSTSECDTAKTNVEKSASKCDTTPNQGGKKKATSKRDTTQTRVEK